MDMHVSVLKRNLTTFSKMTVMYLPLGPMIFSATNSGRGLLYQPCISSFGRDLKANQRAVGYPSNSHAVVAPRATSCLVHPQLSTAVNVCSTFSHRPIIKFWQVAKSNENNSHCFGEDSDQYFFRRYLIPGIQYLSHNLCFRGGNIISHPPTYSFFFKLYFQ